MQEHVEESLIQVEESLTQDITDSKEALIQVKQEGEKASLTKESLTKESFSHHRQLKNDYFGRSGELEALIQYL